MRYNFEVGQFSSSTILPFHKLYYQSSKGIDTLKQSALSENDSLHIGQPRYDSHSKLQEVEGLLNASNAANAALNGKPPWAFSLPV